MSSSTRFDDDPRVAHDVDLSSRSTYGLNARASTVLSVRSRDDLEGLDEVIEALGHPWRTLGQGSNVVLGPGCARMTIVSLEGEWGAMSVDETGLARLGAGLALPVAARRLSSAGWTGFEWAVGIPGSVGGAVVMNAGGHGADTASVLSRVALWRHGRIEWISASELELTYRHSALSDDDVVLEAEIRLVPGDPDESAERLREIVRWRREHQPGGRNAGSVFTNPPGDHAARLLEVAGVKGARRGGAVVSTKHANFILCEPGTGASEVIDLMIHMRDRVRHECGVTLETEHRFIGVEAPW